MRVAVLIVGSVLGLIWGGMTAIAFTAGALSNWSADYMIPVTAAAVVMCLLWLGGVAAVWQGPLVSAVLFTAAMAVGLAMSAVARNHGIAAIALMVLAVMSVAAHYSPSSQSSSSSSLPPSQSA